MASENESEKRETLADIVASMRRGTKLLGYWRSCDVNEILAYHADRIEAAWKREKAEIEANALACGGLVEAERERVVVSKTETATVGNAAARREALVKIRRELNTYCNDCTLPDRMTEDPPDYTCLRDSLLEIERIVDAALSAPPRQCDVGTAEELGMRYKAFCRKHFTPDQLGGNCHKCPLKDRRGWSCQLAWAQMPYSEGDK